MNIEQKKNLSTLPNAIKKGLECFVDSYQSDEYSDEELTQQFLDDSAFYGFMNDYYFLADVIRAGGNIKQRAEAPVDLMEILNCNFNGVSMGNIDDAVLIFDNLLRNNFYDVALLNNTDDDKSIELNILQQDICQFYISKVSQLCVEDRNKYFKLADKYHILPSARDTYALLMSKENRNNVYKIHEQDSFSDEENCFGHSLISHSTSPKKARDLYIDLFNCMIGTADFTERDI